MTDKREPSLESPKPHPNNGDSAATTTTPPNRSKGPPSDPEAFRRWLGIEQLKVDMRRLELETKKAEAPPPRTGHPALPVLYGLILVALLALAAFLTSQVITLREEIGALRTAQTEIAARLTAAPAATPPSAGAAGAAPAEAPASPTPVPPTPMNTPSDATPGDGAAAPSAPASPTAEAEPATPALPGAGYTVRIFAPVNSVPKAKIDNFTSPLKAAGFDVVVSDTGVVQTTNNTLSYHSTTQDMANQVAGIIQRKRPGLDMELRASPSIPPNARQVLILNLTEDALN